MEDTRKKTGHEESNEAGEAKRKREEAEMEGVGEEILAWLSADENTAIELMEVLDSDQTSPEKVRFIANPYSSGLVFQTTPSSYVTINGNEESCGSSFSDWDSSVMASVDYSIGGMGIGAWDVSEEGARGSGNGNGNGNGSVCGEVTDECGVELDEDSLARFLGEILSERSVA